MGGGWIRSLLIGVFSENLSFLKTCAVFRDPSLKLSTAAIGILFVMAHSKGRASKPPLTRLVGPAREKLADFLQKPQKSRPTVPMNGAPVVSVPTATPAQPSAPRRPAALAAAAVTAVDDHHFLD